MVKIIMHGCNGHMGQVITGLVKEDANAEIIAGIDMNDNGQNDYPVFKLSLIHISEPTRPY